MLVVQECGSVNSKDLDVVQRVWRKTESLTNRRGDTLHHLSL